MIDANILVLLSGVLFLIPAYIQFRNYALVKSSSYLLFATLFLLSMLDQVLVSLDSDLFLYSILVSFSFVTIHLILIQMASELVNHHLPVSSAIWKLHALVTFLLLFGLKFLINYNYVNSDYEVLKFLFGEPLRLVTGIALIHSTNKTNLIIESERTLLIKKLWIVTGYVFVLSAVVQFATYSFVVLFDLVLSVDIGIPVILAEVVAIISVLFLAVVATLIAIFYPEAMLLSQSQVIKAAKLYDIIDNTDETESERAKRLFRSEPPDVLIDYVKSLPRDILDGQNVRKES